MIRNSNSLIYKELNKDDMMNWFDLTSQKFLHQIDTFYYSIKLGNDLTSSSVDPACIAYRNFFRSRLDRTEFDQCIPFYCEGLSTQLNITHGRFDQFYNWHMECPELFDIFLAESVPSGPDGMESVTSEIVVQIRSALLWQYGITKAFEYSYAAVKAVCDFFKFTIVEVKENRIDYCWHSNYLQNPEKFFNIENVANMKVTRFRTVNYIYTYKGEDGYESDYVSHGRRGDKCFLRIYHKTKEVVEKGYKAWFLKEWLLNKLINRYDYYVLEKCYLKHSWQYIDKARLEFYLEYGKNPEYKEQIRNILNSKDKPANETISKLADLLTPPVTRVTNVEYQVMRKMSKSFQLLDLHDNSSKGAAKRVYDIFDNHSLITEYLTHSVFRLVDRNTDSKKSRCDYCTFWKSLRSTKLVDVKKAPDELKLVRDYSRRLNAEVVKKRAVSAAVTYSIYQFGKNSRTPLEDAADLLCSLNDNDIEDMKRMKEKRLLRQSDMLYSVPLAYPVRRSYTFIDNDSGEIL